MIMHIACTTVLVCLLGSAPARAQSIPDYDFQWATVGDPNNIPYPGGPEGQKAGAGVVPYTYRISQYEVTTAQWMEFLNAFASFPESETGLNEPGIWGALRGFGDAAYVLDPTIPNAAMVPIFGMSWRSAARYCNWLHNDKAITLEALNTGVYDASTFGNSGSTFTDQLHHNPDAKFWIPTRDEWMKAAHYDPNKYGEDQPGWWEYSHTSDTPAVSGLPGEGQTSVGLPGELQPKLIPLGAYPDVRSPWGLLDTSGGNSEWVEDAYPNGERRFRGIEGSFAGLPSDVAEILDSAWGRTSIDPASRLQSMRIASGIPSPSTSSVVMLCSIFCSRQRQRRIQCRNTFFFVPCVLAHRS